MKPKKFMSLNKQSFECGIPKNVLAGFVLTTLLCLTPGPLIAFEKTAGSFTEVQGEVLEVEEIATPQLSAIYKFRVSPDQTVVQLLADSQHSLIQVDSENTPPADLLPGTRGTVVFNQSDAQNLPVIVFAKMTYPFPD